MLPQLLRHRWMDEDIDAFREQVRRYIEGELSPHLEGWRRQGFIPRALRFPLKSFIGLLRLGVFICVHLCSSVDSFSFLLRFGSWRISHTEFSRRCYKPSGNMLCLFLEAL